MVTKSTVKIDPVSIAPHLKVLPEEKPKNGVAGLKHWKYDLVAGLLVAMVSTPFSIGIAIASGAPPITGLISAIIAGLVLPFLGGSYVTISGPAAGLAPALYAAMLALGGNDLAAGYPLLLPLICMVGLVQIVLSKMKAARFSAIFPAPVVEGMLTAIGLMIIFKQIPLLIGHKFLAHEFWGIVLETPHELLQATPSVMWLGIFTLAVMAGIGTIWKNAKWTKIVPPQVIAVAISTIIAQCFLNLDPKFLIQLPADPLTHGIVFPDFQGVISNPKLWWTALSIVITLTLIDGIESLATINAIDKIDPFRRKSDPDKTLLAMGVSNVASSLVGGLTIIPGGVKSTTSIMAGGRTQWANFFNACFLLLFLFVFRDVINLMPSTVLAAVLVFTGYKLCKPSVWINIKNVGMEQFVLFTATVFITLTTDLMWGIIGGIGLAMLMNSGFIYCLKKAHSQRSLAGSENKPVSVVSAITCMFQNPVREKRWEGRTYHLYLDKPLVCSNYLQLSKELKELPDTAEKIYLHLDESITMMDHTTVENLHTFIHQRNEENTVEIELVGFDRLKALSTAECATRIIDIELEQIAQAG